MNWIERIYELKGKDMYSQNGEGIYLEYIHHILSKRGLVNKIYIDIGSGDGFVLSNTRHLYHLGFRGLLLDRADGNPVSIYNVKKYFDENGVIGTVSIDIDGNDYWILEAILPDAMPLVVIAEFNPSFQDSRTIKHNPDHIWDGTDYYGFSFEAGKKLFEKHGYKVIFNVANMNMIAVRKDLINVTIPNVTYQVTEFFEKSTNREWVFI